MGVYKAQNLLGNQYTRIYDQSTGETLDILGAKVKFHDDFLNGAILTQAAGVPGWTLQDLNTGSEGIIADQPGGIVSLALAANDEEEEAGLHWNDSRHFNLDKGVIIEFRLAAQVLPTLLAELYFGFAGDYVKGTLAAADQGPTVHAAFMLDGSGAVTIHTDDTATDNNAVATGTTLVAAAQHTFRIDCLDPTSVKFYIDGARKASTTTFNMSNGSNVVVQPYLMCYKSAGAGLGTLYVDSVKMWQLSR